MVYTSPTDSFSAHAAKVTIDFNRSTSPSRMIHLVETMVSKIARDCVCRGASSIEQVKCFARTGSSDLVTVKVTGSNAQARCSGRFEAPSETLVAVFFVFVHDLDVTAMEEIVRNAVEHATRQAGKVVVQDLD